MLTELPARDRRFVAVHRLVGEIGGGRPVVLREGARAFVVSPLDGGPLVSDTLALAAPRARFLGLGDSALLARISGGRNVLRALATAESFDTGALEITPAAALAEAASELGKLAERLPAMTVAETADLPADTLSADVEAVLAFRSALATTIEPVATASVPLVAGALATVTAFRNAIGGCASAVVVGEPGPGALVRVHSSCVTGDIFGSLKCDCGAQLRIALDRIAAEGGVLIYTAQEGRGIGLVNKLRAYALQDRGLDTVDANVALGYHDDERDYVAAAMILRQLGLDEARVMTNNPAKIEALGAAGITVSAVPLIAPVTAQNAGYLATKQRRSGHLL